MYSWLKNSIPIPFNYNEKNLFLNVSFVFRYCRLLDSIFSIEFLYPVRPRYVVIVLKTLMKRLM